MKERHQRSTHRSTEIYPEYHPGISAQPMIPESAQAEFWPTTSPRRVGLASCARRGTEGSFLCSPSSRFSGRGGGVGSLPRAWRGAAGAKKKFGRLASVFPSPPFRSSDFAGPRRPRLYGFDIGTRSLSNHKGRGRRSGGREREPRRAGEGRLV